MAMDLVSAAIADLTDDALDERIEPNFNAFLNANLAALSGLVRRQVAIIQRRSADLADHQATVYDKTLLRLTEGGNDIDFIPALRFFSKEYLGIDETNLDHGPLRAHEQVARAHPFDQASTAVASQRDSVVMAEPDTPAANSSIAVHADQDLGPNFRRLMAVYEQARADYLAVADNEDRHTVYAAKFLRDTVENLLDSLRNKTIEAGKRAELDAMAKMAKEAVEKLCGGKKRRFDAHSRSRASKRPRPSSRDARDNSRFSDYHGDPAVLEVEARRVQESRLDTPDRSSSTDTDNEELLLRRISTKSKTYTAEEEQHVVRRLDRRLVSVLSLLYLLSFLDRSNIGNARIAGLESSLQLTANQYDWLLTAFYACYIAFEWMIMLYRVLPPRLYIPVCVLSWGVVASVQSLATDFGQLLVLRGLLGVAEAAFGPGVPFYLSFFYKRSELAYRVGLQISAAPLATSFASSLAWVVVRLSRNGPIESWRMLFLVEGFPSVIAAVVAWYWIPNGPADATWLTPRERRVAEMRLLDHSHHPPRTFLNSVPPNPNTTRTEGRINVNIDWSEILHTLRDPKCYLTALMFFSVNVSFASLPVFLPTIINAMNFSPLASQALAAPPYLCAFFFLLAVAYKSDHVRDSRALFLIAAATLSASSYAAISLAGAMHARLGDTVSITIRYIAVYGAAMGLFAAVTLIITWTLNNQASAEAKGTGMVVLNLVGQCGPLLGVRLFPKTQGPEYVPGMAVCAAFMTGVAFLSGGLRWWLARENRRNSSGVARLATFSFIIGLTARDMIKPMKDGTYIFFAFFSRGGGFSSGYYSQVQTKDKTLEELDSFFGGAEDSLAAAGRERRQINERLGIANVSTAEDFSNSAPSVSAEKPKDIEEQIWLGQRRARSSRLLHFVFFVFL
ncbi:hypothetical protein DV737_g2062, partial [Chaetothyriales sp. CBS 132003]